MANGTPGRVQKAFIQNPPCGGDARLRPTQLAASLFHNFSFRSQVKEFLQKSTGRHHPKPPIRKTTRFAWSIIVNGPERTARAQTECQSDRISHRCSGCGWSDLTRFLPPTHPSDRVFLLECCRS